MRLFHAVSDNGRIAVKQSYERRAEKIDRNADELGEKGSTDESKPRPLFHTVIFSGPKILADKGGQGHGKACNREESKAFYFGIGAAARNGNFPKAVDVGLNDHICDRNDRILNACGQAVPDDLAEHKSVQMNAAQRYTIFCGAFSGQMIKTEGSTDKL